MLPHDLIKTVNLHDLKNGATEMIGILLATYVFIAWTGAWSSHSGSESTVFLILWTLYAIIVFLNSLTSRIFLLMNLARRFGEKGPHKEPRYHRQQDNRENPVGKWATANSGLKFLTALVCWGAYFLKLGDLLNWISPTKFPERGFLWSETSASFWEWVFLIYVLFSIGSFFANCKSVLKD